MSLSSLSSATSPPGAPAIFAHPTSRTVLQVYQAGSQGVTGLAGQISTDLGQTWGAEFQISPRQDVFPAGAVNFGTGDVHLVYSKAGDPALSSSWSVWYRALVWNGSGWTPTGEVVVEAGSAAQGLSNAVVDVDSNGYLTAAYYKKTSSAAVMRTVSSNAPFDLTTTTASDAFSGVIGSNPIQPVLRFLSGIEWWGLMFELDGFVRIVRSATVLSPTQHSLSWTAAQTFFVTPTPVAPLDAAWNPDPDDASNGRLGIAYTEGSTVKFRTWEAQTNTLSAGQSVTAAASQAQAISRYFGEWIVGWMETVSGNQRKLRIAYTSDLSTKYDLDTDPGTAAWQGLRFGGDVSDYDCLMLQWTEGNDPGLDGYVVYLASLAVAIFKNVTDSGAELETIVSGPLVSDSAVAEEGFPTAGEAKSVSDTGTVSESIGPIGRDATDSAHATEAFDWVIQPGAFEDAEGTEVLTVEAEISVSDTGQVTEVVISGVPVPVADSVSIAEVFDMVKQIITVPFTVGELTARAVELLGIDILVQDAAVGSDSIKAGPLVSDAGSASEALSQDMGVNDSGTILEVFGQLPMTVNNDGQTVADRRRYGIVAQVGAKVATHTGIQNSWERRGFAPQADEDKSRLFTFEDLDPSYAGIAFVTTPSTRSAWRRLQRSSDGGRTFSPVGPQQMAAVAWAPGGVLWGVGNDGVAPGEPPPPEISLGGQAIMGYGVTQRMVFKSLDKGITWTRVYDDQAFGNGGRYPSYVHIAVDPGDANRIMALGVARGSTAMDDIQILRSLDGGVNWSTVLPPATEVANFPTQDVLHSDSMLVAGGSRFIFGGTSTDLVAGSHFQFGLNITFANASAITAVPVGQITPGRWRATSTVIDEMIGVGAIRYGVNPSAFDLVGVAASGRFGKRNRSFTTSPVIPAPARDLAMLGSTHAVIVNGATPAQVVTVDPATGAVVGSLVLNPGEGPGVTVEVVGTRGFVGIDSAPGRVVEIDLSDPANPTRVGSVALGAGENGARGLSAADDFLYVITDTSPARIVRFDISGALTRDSHLDLASGENEGLDLHAHSGVLVATGILNPTDSWVARVDVSGAMTRTGGLTIADSKTASAVVVPAPTTYALVTSDDGQNGDVLRKYDFSGSVPVLLASRSFFGIRDLTLFEDTWAIGGGRVSVYTACYFNDSSGSSFAGCYNPQFTGSVQPVNATGSPDGTHFEGPQKIWTSENGSSWVARLIPPGMRAPWVDGTVRSGRAYFVRSDPNLAGLGHRVYTSPSPYTTWSRLNDPGDLNDPLRPSRLSAVAFDHRLKVLYVGMQDDGQSVWRMDDPPSGTWENITDNLFTAVEDVTPHVSTRGLGILSVIMSLIDNSGSDTGRISESFAINISVSDSAVALDSPGVAARASDSASISEALSVQTSSSLTVRLLMHFGRIRLRMEGTNESSVPSNPAG